MKLTLSAGGGITGLSKEHSVDIKSLDDATHGALLNYINDAKAAKPANFNESWSYDEKEVPIDTSKMNEHLKKLYNEMKEQLSYPKK